MDMEEQIEPVDNVTEEQAEAPRRERKRSSRLKIDKEAVAKRVIEFYEQDILDRSMDIQNRLQRYAKFRMWTEGKDWPWENASDAAIPDMMTHSLRVQDTLHNAVMSSRPSVIARALRKVDKDKENTVNDLLDFQFFVENTGELLVGEMADAFVNDGVVTVFTPWVREERNYHEIHTLPPIPDGMTAEAHFSQHLAGAYPQTMFLKADKDGWSWKVREEGVASKWFTVDFYTVNGKIEMDAERDGVVFDAPRPIVKDYEDILCPVRSANLQIPSPSNPGGAAHVIMVDYPTIDEIERLKASGFYDLAYDEEIEKLDTADLDTTRNQEEKQQKDVFQGAALPHTGNNDKETPQHKTLTRLTCFDIFDIDGDGQTEDVIWWVIKETKTLMRARELTQTYPATPPRRPFAESAYIPVRGRRAGVSLLEMMEGLHDMIKQFADQTVDRATITGVPFGFYRASSNMRPEVIRLWPGEMYPLSDPKNDVHFPQMPQQGSTDGLNLMGLFGQMEEKLTNIGDLQLGRVPQGKASALRTVRGMQSVMGQGDARPERILRRFFLCLSDVYKQMHGLNQVFLPADKRYRITGVQKPNEDPFRTIDDPNKVRGEFTFDFTANAMNTSKEALQTALNELMGMYLNPLAIQLGVMKPDGAYQLLRDAGRARGQDPDKYLTPPTPESTLPKMYAEDVLTHIMSGNLPQARPAEATAAEHMQKLMDFSATDEFGYFNPPQVQIFKTYLSTVQQQMAMEQKQQAMMAAAAQFQGEQGEGGMPGPQPEGPLDTEQTPNQPNKLNDMTMPGAGGGANPGPMQ